MRRMKALVALAVITALGILSAAPAVAGKDDIGTRSLGGREEDCVLEFHEQSIHDGTAPSRQGFETN
jgi:hypothetical protein